MRNINVIKADGSIELYDSNKINLNIQRAGIPTEIQTNLIKQIESSLYDGITTAEIYQKVNEYLEKSDNHFFKSRYSLKQSIMLLGPTGYPFEDFVARLFNTMGYSTEVRQILNGKCIKHETDVIARRDGESLMIEVKFHNNPGIKSDVQTVLYTKARFDDVKIKNELNRPCLVTNTKITLDAMDYSNCENIKLLGWKYPENDGLRDIIENNKLYPVTILSSLNTNQKAQLLANHTTLLKDICEKNENLKILVLSDQDKKRVLDEVAFFCH